MLAMTRDQMGDLKDNLLSAESALAKTINERETLMRQNADQ